MLHWPNIYVLSLYFGCASILRFFKLVSLSLSHPVNLPIQCLASCRSVTSLEHSSFL